jgi:hypothetical protein
VRCKENTKFILEISFSYATQKRPVITTGGNRVLLIELDILPSFSNLTLNLGNIPEGVQVMLLPVSGKNKTDGIITEIDYNIVATVDEHGKVFFPELPLGSKFKVVIQDDR